MAIEDLQFDDGTQFDNPDTTTPPINSGGSGRSTSNPPTYNSGDIVINVKGTTPNLSITADGEFKVTTPGSFRTSFNALLGDGIRIRAEKTNWGSTEYYVVKTVWLRREIDRSNEPDGTRTEINEITQPEVIVQKFDKNGNRINTERLNFLGVERQIDIFFEMERIREVEPRLKAPNVFIQTSTSDERLVNTQDERYDLFEVDFVDEDLNVDVTESGDGKFYSGFPVSSAVVGREILIRLSDPKFKVTSFEIFKTDGEFDYELLDQLKTINGQDELRLEIDGFRFVRINYVLREEPEIPLVEKGEVRIPQTSYTYNVSNETPPSIPVELLRGDGVRVEFNGRTFELDMSFARIMGEPTILPGFPGKGRIPFEQSDFNSVGSFLVRVIPYDDELGDGQPKEISIQVTQDPVKRVAQFTTIEYPPTVRGRDYEGYDTDFEIRYETEFTDYVNVYVGDQKKSYGQFGQLRGKSVSLNIKTLINKFNINPQGKDSFKFSLLLEPVFGGDVGISETIEIEFIKSQLQLPKNLVEDNLEKLIFDQLDFTKFDINQSKHLTHIANIEGTDFKLISNWERDDVTFTEFETDDLGNEIPKDGIVNTTLVLKLFEPLPRSIQPNTKLWISKIKSTPFIDRVQIESEGDDECIRLRPANFDAPMKGNLPYEMYDEIVGEDFETSSDIVNKFVKTGKIDTSRLDITYLDSGEYQWKNFIHFSNAEDQVLNFVFKIEMIQNYESEIDNINSNTNSSLPSISNELKRLQSRIESIRRSFTGFEQFLYDNEYPRDGNDDILPVDDSTVENWISSLKGSAIDYDFNNQNSLLNNMPKHITRDNDNEEFLLFLSMIGQHYDIIWSYVNGLKSKNRVEHEKDSGIMDHLIYDMLESFGFDVTSGIATQQLWEYAFGLSQDGDGNKRQLSSGGSEYQNQLWRRLLNNLPFLLKTKGTKRSIKAILSTYGIPQSSLSIIEFGGNKSETSETTQFTYDDTSSSLVFDGETNEYVTVDWNNSRGDYPHGVELRFKTNRLEDQTLIESDNFVNGTSGWKLGLSYNSGSTGRVVFSGYDSGSNLTEIETGELTIFNDQYTSVLLNRFESGSFSEFSVHVRQSFEDLDRINLSSDSPTTGSFSGSVIDVDVSSLNIGGTDTNPFVGTIDEFRLWREPLELGRFENHVLSPDSIDGNKIKSSTEDLFVRFDFEKPKDRGVDTDVNNVAPNIDYTVSGSAVGFTSKTDYPYSHVVYTRSVTADVPAVGFQFADKIRFKDVELISDLSHRSRATLRSSETQGNDSNKVGIYFSPMKEVNLDIIKTFGDFRIDNFIGNPSDIYKRDYGDLTELRHYYFERLNLNIYDYIQLVRSIDKSLFTTLENTIPARSKFSKGLLIEPHFLERSKIEWTRPTGDSKTRDAVIDIVKNIQEEVTNLSFEVELDTQEDVKVRIDTPMYDAILNVEDIEDLEIERLDLEAFINFEDEGEQSADYLVYTGFIDAAPEQELLGQLEALGQLTEVGLDGLENPTVGGFGLYGQDGHVIRTYMAPNGSLERERIFVEKIREYTSLPSGSVSERERIRERLNIRPSIDSQGNPTQPTPVGGNIIEVTPLNGYFSSHYRYNNERSTGLNRSFFEGSSQSGDTTIDGAPAVETFVTNPNTLRVTDAGRGSGEPILTVD